MGCKCGNSRLYERSDRVLICLSCLEEVSLSEEERQQYPENWIVGILEFKEVEGIISILEESLENGKIQKDWEYIWGEAEENITEFLDEFFEECEWQSNRVEHFDVEEHFIEKWGNRWTRDDLIEDSAEDVIKICLELVKREGLENKILIPLVEILEKFAGEKTSEFNDNYGMEEGHETDYYNNDDYYDNWDDAECLGENWE